MRAIGASGTRASPVSSTSGTSNTGCGPRFATRTESSSGSPTMASFSTGSTFVMPMFRASSVPTSTTSTRVSRGAPRSASARSFGRSPAPPSQSRARRSVTM
jgi:hypothetical protein